MCVHVCVYRWVGIEGKCVEDTKIIKTDLKKTVSFVCLFPVRYLKQTVEAQIDGLMYFSPLYAPSEWELRFRHFKLLEFQDDTGQL